MVECDGLITKLEIKMSLYCDQGEDTLLSYCLSHGNPEMDWCSDPKRKIHLVTSYEKQAKGGVTFW